MPTGADVPVGSDSGVFKYLQISRGNLPNDAIDIITFKFKVPNEWFDKYDYDVNNVHLMRYYKEEWQELETKRTSKDADYTYFSATSLGFSIFAITADKAVEQAPVVEEVPEEEVSAAETAQGAEEQQEQPEESSMEAVTGKASFIDSVVNMSDRNLMISVGVLLAVLIALVFFKSRKSSVVEVG